MEVKERLKQILQEKGWTQYRLAKECSIPQATLENIFQRGTVPTIYTLEAICKTLNITLAQFFAEYDLIEMTPELKEFYDT